MSQTRVKTPCIGVCSTGIGDRVCRGCKRFAHEVIDWNSYTEEQKLLIENRLEEFLSRCVSNKLQVSDPELLKLRLDEQQIRFPSHRDAYCWAYCLLKAFASQIGDVADYGLLLHEQYRDTPLGDLRLMIDDEYFTLSDAYYERYISLSELA